MSYNILNIKGNFYKKRFAPNDEKIICHISNFRKVKRIQDLLKAFEIISKKIKVKLLLVGDGPERSCLEKISRESNFVGNAVKSLLGINDNGSRNESISDIRFLTE